MDPFHQALGNQDVARIFAAIGIQEYDIIKEEVQSEDEQDDKDSPVKTPTTRVSRDHQLRCKHTEDGIKVEVENQVEAESQAVVERPAMHQTSQSPLLSDIVIKQEPSSEDEENQEFRELQILPSINTLLNSMDIKVEGNYESSSLQPNSHHLNSGLQRSSVSDIVLSKIYPTNNILPEMHSTNSILSKIHPINNILSEIHPTNNILPEMHSTNSILPKIHPTNNILPKIHPKNNILPEIHPTNNILPKIHPTNNIFPEIHPTDNILPEIHPTDSILPEIHPINNIVGEIHSSINTLSQIDPNSISYSDASFNIIDAESVEDFNYSISNLSDRINPEKNIQHNLQNGNQLQKTQNYLCENAKTVKAGNVIASIEGNRTDEDTDNSSTAGIRSCCLQVHCNSLFQSVEANQIDLFATDDIDNIAEEEDRKPFLCDYCDLAFKDKSDCDKHTREHEGFSDSESRDSQISHKSVDQNLLDCDYSPDCDESSYLTPPNLSVPQVIPDLLPSNNQPNHDPPPPQKQPRVYSCANCSFQTNERYYIKIHIFSRHDILLSIETVQKIGPYTIRSDFKENLDTNNENIRKYLCNFCNYSTNCESAIKRHGADKHKIKDDSTPDSNSLLSNATNTPEFDGRYHKAILKKNMALINRRVKTCPKCNYTSSWKKDISRHVMAVHSKGKPHTCHICLYTFSQNSSLKRHILTIHQGNKAFQCEFCDARFSQKGTLKLHVSALHRKERPFTCHQCDFSSSQKIDVIKHISSVHSKSKPFTCTACSSSFGSKRDLIQHMVLHKPVRGPIVFQKSYKCDLCPYSTTKRKHLISHVYKLHF